MYCSAVMVGSAMGGCDGGDLFSRVGARFRYSVGLYHRKWKRTKVAAGRGTGTVGPSTGTSIGNGLEARNLDRYCNGY
jgi:hypothetical protein